MQPGAVYYLILYAIIIALQFFKLFKQVKTEPDKYSWRNYFYVSLQVVYTSAGVAVLLVAQLRDWMAVIMVAYLLLVLISSFLDTVGAEFRDNTRVTVHLIIIASVTAITIISYQKVLPKSAPPSMARHYKVALPYMDNTLARYVSPDRMGDRLLYFSTSVDAPSRAEARDMALRKTGGSIKPFKPSRKGNPSDVVVLSDQAVIEELAK